jgi:hypothetical protein
MSLARVTRVVSVPVALGLSLAMLLGVAGLGARLPGLSVLSGVPQLRALDYSVDRFGRLAPLNDRFVLQALGSGSVAQGLGAGAEGGRSPAPVRPSPEPTPQETPGREGNPGDILADWDLRPSMRADRSTARPGDRITYTITVTNVGTADYPGTPSYTVRAHIPYHTTYLPEDECEPGTAPPDGGCIDVPVAEPGSSDPEAHQYNDTRGNAIGPGKFVRIRFSVVVDPNTASGTKLVNDAHVDVAARARRTSGSVVVVVT